MKIGIIGATGKAGQELFTQASHRQHEVTARKFDSYIPQKVPLSLL